MNEIVPFQEQGTTSVAAATFQDHLPHSPTRVNHFELSLTNVSQNEAVATETNGKPFQDSPEHDTKLGENPVTDNDNDQCARNGDNPQNGDNPEIAVEDKGGTIVSTSIPVQNSGAPSSVVTGSSCWTPDMSVEIFRFSHCREWRLHSEFVGPKWTLSQAIAPGTFQKYTVPYPHQ